MNSIVVRWATSRAWLLMLAASALACGVTEQDGTVVVATGRAQRQALTTEGQVCVTVQRGAAGHVEDASIWQVAPRNGIDGTHPHLDVGTSPSGDVRRSLLHFDLAAVPTDAHVLSAKLRLFQANKGGPDSTVNVLRTTAPWSEGTVTWSGFGEAFEPTPVASIPVSGRGASGPRIVDVSPLAQGWVRGSTPNHGIVLEDTSTTLTRFDSSESPHAAQRPALTVCYVTCYDGVQNGDETGFDCGGAFCGQCDPPPGEPSGTPVEPVGTSLLVRVVDADTAPISGATVILSGVEKTTDGEGNALFEGLPAGGAMAQVRATGFAPGAVPVALEAGTHGSATASLNPLSPPIAFNADVDATVITEEVQVGIPASSLLDENGQPVTGTAEIAFAPIDPTTDDIISAPGAFVGISSTTGEARELESGFMAEIALTQNGRPLHLAPGATASVTFTLPEEFNAVPGELIQAWWFDTEAGVWREDGAGIVEESPTEPGKLTWTVEVSHFTSWNCDRPWSTRSCANVLVVDQEGRPLSGRTVTARGLSYSYRGSAITGASGQACVPVMRGGFAQVSVGSEWAPLAWQNITPNDVASCGSSSCTPVTLTVNVSCGAPGTIQACSYTGRSGTQGVGTCKAGYRVCDGFSWGPCTGQVTPTAEVCENTLDEDCDGKLNDGCPVCVEGSTQSCYGGPTGTEGVGACHAGVKTCVNGTWSACTDQVVPMGSEICGNEQDEDCDGLTNEGCTCTPGETQPCYTGPAGTEGVGVCQVGQRQCFGSRESRPFWGACTGEVVPVSESCDNLDNDCNGQVDDGNPGGGVACSTGQLGVCTQGTTTCSGGTLVCAANTPASPEICDGKDNDCDGQSDEGNPGGGASCSTGLPGICSAGKMMCQSGGLTCVQSRQPVAEDCNTSADDDCDGQVNEGCNTDQMGSFYYSASNTYSATRNTTDRYVSLSPGQTIAIGTCGLPGAWASGDTFIRLHRQYYGEVAADDDGCIGLSSYLSYTVPPGAGGTYIIKAGCYSTGSCSGNVVYKY
jgi:hypothetical protein